MASAPLLIGDEDDSNDQLPPISSSSFAHEPPHGTSNKRVSFDEHQVRTFVYEKETTDGSSSELSRIKQPFTDSDAPPNRVTVVAERSETPSTIFPPTQLEDTRQSTVSPPLPALVKRMESEIENPFRPEEPLFKEVDPIVEAYMKKPYPPSLPGSQQGSPVKGSQAYINGISPSSLIAEKVEKQASTSLETAPLAPSPVKNGGSSNSTDCQDVPKPSQVECVRIEKKKKKRLPRWRKHW